MTDIMLFIIAIMMVQAIKVRDFQALQLQGAGFPKGREARVKQPLSRKQHMHARHNLLHTLCVLFFFFCCCSFVLSQEQKQGRPRDEDS